MAFCCFPVLWASAQNRVTGIILDEEGEHAAYWVGWIDRHGAFKYKVTCFE